MGLCVIEHAFACECQTQWYGMERLMEIGHWQRSAEIMSGEGGLRLRTDF